LDFEALLRSPDLGQTSLLLPHSLNEEASLGISLAFTQFLLTWSRQCETPIVRSFLRLGDETKFERFVQRVGGFAAAYYSKRVLPFDNNELNLRRALLLAAKPRFEAMYRGNLTRTCRHSEIEFIFLEDAELEFHGAMYSKAPSPVEIADREAHGRLIRSKRELNRFLERAFTVLEVHEKFRKQLMRVDLPFGSLLAEAFKNTAEHGYLQAGGERLSRNMRCVRVARSQTRREWMEKFSVASERSQEAASAYFRGLASNYGERHLANVQMLEISVYDSGPGFSATIRNSRGGQEISDLALVGLCVEKHRSSKPQETAGIGLYRMLSAVDALGGFLRIRTSSAEAFYATTEGFAPDMPPGEFVHGGLADAQGTLITVGIPIAF